MQQIFKPRFLLSLIAVAVVCSQGFAAVNDSGMKVAWGYKGGMGPEFWGRLSPSYILCGQGKAQSPIDISKNDVTTENTLALHYHPASVSVMDDGSTELTIGSTKTVFNDGRTVQVNFKDEHQPETISYAGNTYQLVQFHFHSPSEDQLNGESAPLEIHFVHQGKNGKVLVIGVLVKGGNTHPALQIITDHLPRADGKEYAISGEKMNPNDLFPLDHDYYSFPGSLTTPPCSEGLQWIVMAGTITASPAQIATIRKAIGGSNARSVQPLNNRVIAYSPGKIS